MSRRSQQGLGHGTPPVYDVGRAGCGSVDPMSSRHPIFTARARGAAGDACAASSTPRCVRTSTSGRRPGTSPTRSSAAAASSASSASTTPPAGAAATATSRPGLVFVEELARCGAGAIPMAISVQTRHGHARARRVRHRRPARALARAPRSRATKIGAIAITEPDAGSDVAAIRTRAVRDGDVWRVNGRKMFITNGTRAHFLTLVAKTDPDAGHHGVSLFIVDTSLPGVSVSRRLEKLGMHSSDTAEIALDDVAVPAADLIGLEPGQGFAQLMWQLQYERLAGAAACVGHAAQTLDDTIAYARERRRSGGRSRSTR